MIPTSVVGFRAPRKLTQSPLPALTREIARTHTRNHGRVSGIRADDVTGRTRVGRRARRRASDLSRKARGSHAVETGAAGGVIFGAGAESSPSRRYLGDLAKTLNAAAAPSSQTCREASSGSRAELASRAAAGRVADLSKV